MRPRWIFWALWMAAAVTLGVLYGWVAYFLGAACAVLSGLEASERAFEKWRQR